MQSLTSTERFYAVTWECDSWPVMYTFQVLVLLLNKVIADFAQALFNLDTQLLKMAMGTTKDLAKHLGTCFAQSDSVWSMVVKLVDCHLAIQSYSVFVLSGLQRLEKNEHNPPPGYNALSDMATLQAIGGGLGRFQKACLELDKALEESTISADDESPLGQLVQLDTAAAFNDEKHLKRPVWDDFVTKAAHKLLETVQLSIFAKDNISMVTNHGRRAWTLTALLRMLCSKSMRITWTNWRVTSSRTRPPKSLRTAFA